MLVRMSITVDVNPEQWELEYGIDRYDKIALRKDVKSYLRGQIACSAAADAGAMTLKGA